MNVDSSNFNFLKCKINDRDDIQDFVCVSNFVLLEHIIKESREKSKFDKTKRVKGYLTQSSRMR